MDIVYYYWILVLHTTLVGLAVIILLILRNIAFMRKHFQGKPPHVSLQITSSLLLWPEHNQ